MAIRTEFIDVIVPRKIIEQKFNGGWEQCLKEHEHLIGKRVWFDQHLFRDGAMNSGDAEEIVKQWEARGFTTCEVVAGQPKKWKEVCVYEWMWGPTLECDWISIDRKTRSVYLTGEEMGDVVWKEDV